MKTCSKCKEGKSFDEFSKNITRKDGYHNQCKDCNKADGKVYHEKNRDEVLRKQRIFYIENKESEKTRQTVYLKNNKAVRILLNMRNVSKKRGFSPPEWTVEEIRDIIDGGTCPKSGIKFLTSNESGSHKNPFSASADRIDNTKGYMKSNVQFVCWLYNHMKSDYSEEVVDAFTQGLISKQYEKNEATIKRRLGFHIV